MRAASTILVWIGVICAVSGPALAEKIRAGRPPAGPGAVNLPYTVNDNAGNQWMLYQGGWLRQQGNMPMYSQAAMILINNNGVGSNSNQARLDEKTGEVVFENMVVGAIRITRRVLVNTQDGYVRYIDIFKNTQGQDQNINVAFQTNFNYGVMSSQIINDPKGKDRALGCAATLQTGTTRAIWEMYGGRGVKDIPQLQFQPENNMVRASSQIVIPGNKEVAILHLHGTSNTQEAAAQFVTSIREGKLLSDVAPALRKLIFNFGSPNSYVEDREILRGEMFDVVEMRGGDVVRGTLGEKSYKLATFYGNIDLPAERVIGLINVGQFRPRQLVITTDGEVFGGKLDKETVELQLSSGQVTQIPLSQVSRIGYRKRAGEPDEWNFDKPAIMLRSGERIGIDLPPGTIDVLTRYGLLQLKPESIGAIVFQAEEHGVHEVYLTDGSAFAGLVSSPQFQLKLSGPTGTPQMVTIPAAAVRRFQLSGKIDEPGDDTPSLLLSNEDRLVGTLTGELKLDTAFDTITIDASEVRGMTRVKDAGLDVQITLWDQTSVSGQLQSPQVSCALNCGLEVQVPLALVEEYSNPHPLPSPRMIERIKAVVAELNAEDWKQRERAEAQLISMGPAVIKVLQEMSASQPPEAQQRIDSILKALDKTSGPSIPPPVRIED